ncbi:MAG: hypothetical protein J1F31_03430 [Erysipelotrichales bacterium]|nr:hypothetical protein [Erysipelotrichales bacterium]
MLLYGSLYANKVIKKYIDSQRLVTECANFINTFIISLSISNSLEMSYKDATTKISKQMEKAIKQKCKSLDVLDNLEMLQEYFKSTNYAVFLNILKMHINNGGNILEMSVNLQLELRRKEEIVNSIKQINNRKIYEFFTLWAFCLAIILFCRLGLNNIYAMMQSYFLFNYEIIFFFAFMVFSFHLFISSITNSIKKVI